MTPKNYLNNLILIMQEDPILLLKRFLLKNFGSDFLYIGELKFCGILPERKRKSGRRGSLLCRLASRALSNLGHAQWIKWLSPPLPTASHPRHSPRLRSNFAVKFERMPCKSRNRGQFRGNVNKYRCTLVSRATVPGYELVVSLAQSPCPAFPGPTVPLLSLSSSSASLTAGN